MNKKINFIYFFLGSVLVFLVNILQIM